MKRSIMHTCLGLLLGLSSLGWTGCESAIGDTPGHREGFTFRVNLPDPIQVETKAGMGVDLINIQNIWIVQYNSESGVLLNCVYLNSGFTDVHEGFMMQVTTDQKAFSDVQSRFYMIVNGGPDLLKGFKEAAAENSEADLKRKRVLMDAPLMTSAPMLLTSESIEYTPEEGKDKVIVISRLYRAYAKFSLTMLVTDASSSDTSAPSFTLDAADGVTLTYLPDSMALYTAAGENGNYPHRDYVSSTSHTLAGAAIGGTKKHFWMAENLRGTGSSDSFSGKNKEANGPGGTLTGCTFLTIKGTYKYHASDAAGIKVEYRFYLGSNLTRDYNIRRDHHYDITINLKGANSADMRVTITDGNVAVFDDVDEVTNEVEF